MFVPAIHRKTIERQSIQHILLMLLRMGCFLLLALAFARPYFYWIEIAPQNQAASRHVILFDISASMNAEGRLQTAKNEALAILSSLNSEDQAALIPFDRHAEIRVPFPASESGLSETRALLHTEINQLQAGFQTTAYLPALQKAQDLLIASNRSTEKNTRKVIHLISDFQKKGLPQEETHWKLSPQIEFNPISIGEGNQNRFSLIDIAIRQNSGDEFRISGQVKNETDHEETACRVRLFLDGKEKEQQEIFIPPNHSTKVTFPVSLPGQRTLMGWLEVGPDKFAADNRRYFTWNPEQKKEVWLVRQTNSGAQWPASWFIAHALRTGANHHWVLTEKIPTDLTELHNGENPDMLILCGAGGLDENIAQATYRFIQEGGGVLLLLDEPAQNPTFVNHWLYPIRLRLDDSAANSESIRETFTWIDFDHPIFFPFRGTKYNDFTAIQFNQYIPLQWDESIRIPAVSNVHKIACFENAHPAMAEANLGGGRMILWTFTPDLQTTNLPKSSRFVPVLFETLRELEGYRELPAAYTVGEAITGFSGIQRASDHWDILLPGKQSIQNLSIHELHDHPIVLMQPGILSLTHRGPSPETFSYPVNLDASEADLTTIPIDQFEYRLISNAPAEIAPGSEPRAAIRKPVVQREWGRWILFILLLGFVMESGYAARLARRASTPKEM